MLVDTRTDRTVKVNARGEVVVRDAWYETELVPGWTAAYRFVISNRRLVVAEVRVFPSEPDAGHRAGEWSAKWFGVHAWCPSRGLTTRVLKKLRTAAHVESARDFVANPPPELKIRKKEPPQDIGPGRTMIRELSSCRPRRKAESVSAARGHRQGRPPRPALFYAKAAKAYSDAISEGRPPEIEVERVLDLRRGAGKSVVFKARERGFLSPAPGQGVPGGTLTDDGRKVLAQAREARLP